jgi:hypothetical protein
MRSRPCRRQGGLGYLSAVWDSHSPSEQDNVAADLEAHRFDLTLRKEILWKSEMATDAELQAMEVKLTRDPGANNRAIGDGCVAAVVRSVAHLSQFTVRSRQQIFGPKWA